jgi:lysophospholipase L1-like esterase
MRAIGIPVLSLILTLAVAGYVRPVAAAAAATGTDSGCSSFGSSFASQPIDGDGTGLRVGCARDSGNLRSLAGNDSDFVAAIDFKITQRPDQFHDAMNKVVDDTRADLARGMSLSQSLTLRVQRDNVGFSSLSDDVKFGGTIQASGDSLVIVVPAGDIGTAGFWTGFWKKVVTGAVVMASAVVIAGLCLLAFNVGAPAAAPVCGAVSSALSAGIGELVSAALDNKPIDREVWGNAVGSALAGAVAGAFLGALAQYFSAGSRLLIASLQETLRRYAAVFGNWKAPLEFLGNLMTSDAAVAIDHELQRIAHGVGSAHLKVMAMGDQITSGAGSSDGSGYLAKFKDLAAQGSSVELVGSQHSGPSALANEGFSGSTIAGVESVTDSALATYQPDVVLLHVGTVDMNNDIDPGDAASHLGDLIDLIFRTRPGVSLVVSTLVPSADEPTQAKIDAYNAAIPGVVATRQQAGKHVKLVSMNAVTTANLADGMDPNDRGYQKMATSFYRGVITEADAGWFGGVTNVMVVGDSISNGFEGDATWRARLQEWFRSSNWPARLVGPYTGTTTPGAGSAPQPPALLGVPSADPPPFQPPTGAYAANAFPAGGSDHFAVWGRQMGQDVPRVRLQPRFGRLRLHVRRTAPQSAGRIPDRARVRILAARVVRHRRLRAGRTRRGLDPAPSARRPDQPEVRRHPGWAHGHLGPDVRRARL